MESNVQSLKETLDTMNGSVSNLSVCLQEHTEQTTAELAHLQNTINSTQSSQNTQLNDQLDDLSSKLDTVNASFFQHQKQATAELAHLQTSFNFTNSKLDSLMIAAAELSPDHQEIQINVSDVHCMDTQQNLQDDLTHQLQTIKRNIESLPAYNCGGTGGWRRVVYLDMTDPHTTCPSGWKMTGYSKRTCGRRNNGWHTCSSATFSVNGVEYSRVCGRIKAYQWGATLAFLNFIENHVTTIDGAYACGVSLTHGISRNHIWTFVSGLSEGNPTWSSVCPCDSNSTINIPPFVGNDYFCESGVNEQWFTGRHYRFHPNDALWDGEACLPSSTCCSQHNPPYFTKQLPTPTTDDIEARICMHVSLPGANLAVELVELYVQ